jgi:hypothetical protein
MSNPFVLFTRDSHSVLARAKSLAKKQGQEVITPNHLLFGILDLSGCQAEQVLARFPFKLLNLKPHVQALSKLEAKETDNDIEIGYKDWRRKLSVESAAILEEANAEAKENDLKFVDTRLLILGILRHGDNSAAQLLEQYDLSLEGFRAEARLSETPPVNLPRFELPDNSHWPPIQISPVFWGLVAWTVFFGGLIYAGIGNPSASAMFFILGGTTVSVALHEFGHALVAYLGGDGGSQRLSDAKPSQVCASYLKYCFPDGLSLNGWLAVARWGCLHQPLTDPKPKYEKLDVGGRANCNTLMYHCTGYPFHAWLAYAIFHS